MISNSKSVTIFQVNPIFVWEFCAKMVIFIAYPTSWSSCKIIYVSTLVVIASFTSISSSTIISASQIIAVTSEIGRLSLAIWENFYFLDSSMVVCIQTAINYVMCCFFTDNTPTLLLFSHIVWAVRC